MAYSRRVAALSLCAALQLLSQSATANPRLSVTNSAAFAGLFGLEVTVVPCSVAPDIVIPGPSSISGVFEACRTVTAQDIEIVAPGATFRAGGSVVLENGFHVAEGAAFEASTDPLLSSYAWVEDQTPAAEPVYKASYYFNLDGLPLVEGENLDSFVGLSSNATPQFRLFFQRNDLLGEDRLLIATRLDNGVEVTTAWGEGLLLPAGWNYIEVDWQAGPGTGHLLVTLNGSASTELTDLANDGRAIDSIRWGMVASDSDLLMATSGILFLDEFRSWR